MTAPAPQRQPNMEHALPWSATANSWQYTTIYDANRATVCRFDLEDRGVTEDNQDTLEKQQEQTVNLVVIAVNSYATLTAQVEEQQKICDSYAEENQRFHDRIEHLEKALRAIDTHLDNFGYPPHMKARKIASAALNAVYNSLAALPQAREAEPVAWRWRTLPKFSEDAADQEWSLTLTAPDFINPHHHDVEPLYASPSPIPDAPVGREEK